MDKIVPDPPVPPVTPSMDNPFTRDLLKDRAALYRALDYYLPDANPSSPDELRFYNVSKDVSFEDSMLYTADLLRCASVTAYECGDHLKGAERSMVFAVWHLLEIAKAMVDQSIGHLGPRSKPAPI